MYELVGMTSMKVDFLSQPSVYQEICQANREKNTLNEEEQCEMEI